MAKVIKKKTAARKATQEEPNRKDTFIEFLLEGLNPLGSVTVKKMFGGQTLFCGGVAFALIESNILYLKADGVNRPHFQSLGMEPFKPFEDKPEIMQYYSTSADVLEDSDQLVSLASEAVAAGRRAAKKKAGKKRKGA